MAITVKTSLDLLLPYKKEDQVLNKVVIFLVHLTLNIPQY